MRQMAATPEAAPLDAQILMEAPKEKEAVAQEVSKPAPAPPKRAKPTPVVREQTKTGPALQEPQRPAPAPQAARPQAPSVQPATSARDISLPDDASNGGTGPALPAANPSAPGGTGSPFGPRLASRGPAPSENTAGGETSLPGFGAAYLNNPKPAYPAFAKKMGMEGKVMLKVFVSREGRVLQIEVGQSSGYDVLDKAALDAVKIWRFVPARRGDAAIDEWVQVPIAFRLSR